MGLCLPITSTISTIASLIMHLLSSLLAFFLNYWNVSLPPFWRERGDLYFHRRKSLDCMLSSNKDKGRKGVRIESQSEEAVIVALIWTWRPAHRQLNVWWQQMRCHPCRAWDSNISRSAHALQCKVGWGDKVRGTLIDSEPDVTFAVKSVRRLCTRVRARAQALNEMAQEDRSGRGRWVWRWDRRTEWGKTEGVWNAPVMGALLLRAEEKMKMQGWKLLCHSELGSA